MDACFVEAVNGAGCGGEAFAVRPHEGPDRLLLMRILDEIDYGVMLVAASCNVRYANKMALRECLRLDGLRIHDQHVRARDARDQSNLVGAIERALRGRRSLVTLGREEPPQSLAVVPVASQQNDGLSTAALLVFGKRRVCETLSLEFFAQAHRLTNAEVAVLRGLCDGLSPVQLAERIGVAISTIRTQIGSVREKTATASIRELVGRVVVLPPILLALDRMVCEVAPALRVA